MHDPLALIASPRRREILRLLWAGERSAGQVRAAMPDITFGAVSQHLRILLDAGLVTEQRHGRERRYRLVPERLGPVRDWIAHYERFWDDRLQRLQKLLSKRGKE